MAFDADKFAENISATQRGGQFRLEGPDFRATITHEETINAYLLTIQSTAVIIFDDWGMNEDGLLVFRRRYVGYDGDIFFMTSGTVSMMNPARWTVGDMEASQ